MPIIQEANRARAIQTLGSIQARAENLSQSTSNSASSLVAELDAFKALLVAPDFTPADSADVSAMAASVASGILAQLTPAISQLQVIAAG